jgi:hypothetical protein
MKEKVRLTGWLLGMNCDASLPTRIKRASVQWKHPSSPSAKKFKVMPLTGKVTLTVFWDSHGVLLSHFQNCGENMNSASYCEVLLKLHDVCRKSLRQVAKGVLLQHDNARPHTARVTRREFKNYSGNFLKISLTAWTCPLVTSICLVC